MYFNPTKSYRVTKTVDITPEIIDVDAPAPVEESYYWSWSARREYAIMYLVQVTFFCFWLLLRKP